MARPEVTVVMPFAGEASAADAALASLRALDALPGDELILVDNSAVAAAREQPGITVVRAISEHSPAHARNAGAARADGEWVLFLDADCHPGPALLESYFAEPVGEEVGALAGEVVPASGGRGLASRYAASRSFLSQSAHLAHPYRPRAAAANLLVRRRAFEQLGGFFEGLRAAEDTDFCWRLQDAGWRLELRAQAWASHRYRTTLGDLRRQWRGYAAGRAWLARRYEDFRPQPALLRALGRRTRRSAEISQAAAGGGARGATPIIDALLGVEELVGFLLSNRPGGPVPERRATVVLLSDRFPLPDDPMAELATALESARVQAVARPARIDADQARRLRIDYAEDDGLAVRVLASARLLALHPLRCALDRLRFGSARPPLSALAPAALRLEREPAARVLALGSPSPAAPSARLARLAGRRLDEAPRP